MNTIENAGNTSNKDFGFDGQKVFAPIKDHLLRVQKPFLDALSVSSQHPHKPGWEHIGKYHDTGRIEALPTEDPSEKTVFTGATLCALANIALFDGLKEILPAGIDLSLKRMLTFFNKESYFGGLKYHEVFGDHGLLAMEDKETGKILYIDPTYGQIRHQWAGKFLMTPSIEPFYETKTTWEPRLWDTKKPIVPSDLIDSTAEKDAELGYQLNHLMVPESAYQKLVQAILGSK